MPHSMIVLITYINLLILSGRKKMSIFEDYGAFNAACINMLKFSEIFSYSGIIKFSEILC